MVEYHKIQSVFKRDEKTRKFLIGQYSKPEFEYLKDNVWIFTEKVDGTNIRVNWFPELRYPSFGGRTENAQIPTFLYDKLNELFTNDKFKTLYPETPMTLYGEGYGAKIQKSGGNYISDGVDFILFDVMIESWWLKREDVEDIAKKLGIKTVPVISQGSLADAMVMIKDGLLSQWGSFYAEGLVLKPQVELKDRAGRRIITKMKRRDFV